MLMLRVMMVILQDLWPSRTVTSRLSFLDEVQMMYFARIDSSTSNECKLSFRVTCGKLTWIV